MGYQMKPLGILMHMIPKTEKGVNNSNFVRPPTLRWSFMGKTERITKPELHAQLRSKLIDQPNIVCHERGFPQWTVSQWTPHTKWYTGERRENWWK